MLDAPLIKKLFKALNDGLSGRDIRGEIGICGGAVMYLVFHARKRIRFVKIWRERGSLRGISPRPFGSFFLLNRACRKPILLPPWRPS